MILTATQQVTLGPISVVDAEGNTTTYDGAPVWASSDPLVIGLTVAAGGLSALAVATTNLGMAQVSVTVDADTTEGVKPLIGTVDFEVVAGSAVSITVPAGTPEEQASESEPIPTPLAAAAKAKAKR